MKTGKVAHVGSGTRIFSDDPLQAGIVCPVIKTTSWDNSNGEDALLGVSMDIVAPNSGALSCNLYIYDAATTGASSLKWTYPGIISGSGTNFVVTFQPMPGNPAVKTFWTSSIDWLYAEIRCDPVQGHGIGLNTSAAVNLFKVSEAGSDHAERIYPASVCQYAVDGLVSGPFGEYVIEDSPSGWGWVHSLQGNNSANQFEWDCHKLDNAHYVDFMVGHNYNSTIQFVGTHGGLVNIPPNGTDFPITFHSKFFNSTDDAFSVLSTATGDTRFTSYRTYH
ncbi:MAG TPA: hypothetical protein VHJ20_06155 [Polyangia bacterium]|nr:hypothetical protein [Polyangia bacterium]